jgi:hypothetical protein
MLFDGYTRSLGRACGKTRAAGSRSAFRPTSRAETDSQTCCRSVETFQGEWEKEGPEDIVILS